MTLASLRLACRIAVACFAVSTFVPAAVAAPASIDVAVVCAACGKQIGPGRYLQDQWKACFHVQHAQVTRCYYCARGISEFNTHGGVHYADGRDVCNICQSTAVVDEATARALTDGIRGRMGAWGLQIAYGDIPLQLVDQPTLDRLFGHASAMHDGKINGLTTKRWTKDAQGKVQSREVSISLLYGLPREIFEKTVAHELMHAWMFVDNHPEHAPALEEGACNLASYYILQESPSPLSGFLKEAMYRSTSPTYGAGLRRAIHYVQDNQFSGLVRMLRIRRDFPAGY